MRPLPATPGVRRAGGRIPTVMQRDLSDCGAACLSSIARHYRRPLPLALLAEGASRISGHTVLGLVEAATSLGFTAKGVKGPIEGLRAFRSRRSRMSSTANGRCGTTWSYTG